MCRKAQLSANKKAEHKVNRIFSATHQERMSMIGVQLSIGCGCLFAPVGRLSIVVSIERI
jgi:hypothetical protein